MEMVNLDVFFSFLSKAVLSKYFSKRIFWLGLVENRKIEIKTSNSH